jgi:hypothetical protein
MGRTSNVHAGSRGRATMPRRCARGECSRDGVMIRRSAFQNYGAGSAPAGGVWPVSLVTPQDRCPREWHCAVSAAVRVSSVCRPSGEPCRSLKTDEACCAHRYRDGYRDRNPTERETVPSPTRLASPSRARRALRPQACVRGRVLPRAMARLLAPSTLGYPCQEARRAFPAAG